MAIIRPKNKDYGIIQRGASLTIPVTIKDAFDKPLDLTEYAISFTMKDIQSDYDIKDKRSFIQKDFIPQEPTLGKFYVLLSSDDTNIPPNKYYFDIEVTNPNTGVVYRICTLGCEIVGGPTNRTINEGIGQLPIGDEITIITLQGAPIIVIAPAVAINPNTYEKIDELSGLCESLQKKLIKIEGDITVLNEHVALLEETVANL